MDFGINLPIYKFLLLITQKINLLLEILTLFILCAAGS